MSTKQQHRPRPDDFVELAVTGQSTCRLCQSKIAKGAMRVAIHHLSKGKYWNRYYYHKECMSSTKGGKELMKKAQFREIAPQGTKRKGDCISPIERIELEAATVLKKKRISEATVNAREDLWQMLKVLRTSIARHIQKAPYMVFHDSTLASLVERLPCTNSELMDVPGIGPIKCQSLGPMILPLIQAYKRSLSSGANATISNINPAAPPSISPPGHEEEEVVFESEVSIDDMIRKKIREAEERGEVIEL